MSPREITTTGADVAVAVSAATAVAVVVGSSVADGVIPGVEDAAGVRVGSGEEVGCGVGEGLPPVHPRVERTNPAAAALPLMSNWRRVNLRISENLLVKNCMIHEIL